MNPSLLPLAVCGLLTLASCGDKGPDHLLRKSLLSKLGMAYHGFNSVKRRPPASTQELAAYLTERNDNPEAIALLIDPLKQGDIILIWNAILVTDGDTNDKYVLGYEKNVPESGGYMVTGGGFVQPVTAQQFASRPKIATSKPSP